MWGAGVGKPSALSAEARGRNRAFLVFKGIKQGNHGR